MLTTSRKAFISRLKVGGCGATADVDAPVSASRAAANFGCLRTAARVASSSAFRFIGKRRALCTLTPTVSILFFCGLHSTPSTSSKSPAVADIAASQPGDAGRHDVAKAAADAAPTVGGSRHAS